MKVGDYVQRKPEFDDSWWRSTNGEVSKKYKITKMRPDCSENFYFLTLEGLKYEYKSTKMKLIEREKSGFGRFLEKHAL